MYTCIYISYIYIHKCMFRCTYIHVCVCVFVCICIDPLWRIVEYMHVCTYRCTHKYKFIH